MTLEEFFSSSFRTIDTSVEVSTVRTAFDSGCENYSLRTRLPSIAEEEEKPRLDRGVIMIIETDALMWNWRNIIREIMSCHLFPSGKVVL